MDWSLWLVVVIFSLVFLGFLSSMYALSVTRVPVLRTPPEVLQGIKEALDLKSGQQVVDAGCADGRVLRTICSKEGVGGIGYELNGPVWFIACWRTLFSKCRRRVKIRWRDFFRSELEGVDLVYCYLMPGLMPEVADKCLEEMAPGSRLASFLWEVPDWEAEQIVRLGPLDDPLFIYRLPSCAGAVPPPNEQP